MFQRKKLVVLIAVVLLTVVTVPALTGASFLQGFSEEEARLVLVTKQTSYRIVKAWDVPQEFIKGSSQRGEYTIPQDVAEIVFKFVGEAYDYEFGLIGYVNPMKDKVYDVLILLSEMEKPGSIGQIKHLEIIVNDKNIETVKEVTPEKLRERSETSEEEWRGAVNVEDERVMTKIVIEKSVVTYGIKLESASLVEIEAWTTIEGRNIFGIVLWSLTAKGLFGVYLNQAVLWVIDESTVWANGWLGWWYANFVHSSQILYGGLFGIVNAESDFYGPFWQSVHAWAWVRVWYDGYVDGNAGT